MNIYIYYKICVYNLKIGLYMYIYIPKIKILFDYYHNQYKLYQFNYHGINKFSYFITIIIKY